MGKKKLKEKDNMENAEEVGQGSTGSIEREVKTVIVILTKVTLMRKCMKVE